MESYHNQRKKTTNLGDSQLHLATYRFNHFLAQKHLSMFRLSDQFGEANTYLLMESRLAVFRAYIDVSLLLEAFYHQKKPAHELVGGDFDVLITLDRVLEAEQAKLLQSKPPSPNSPSPTPSPFKIA